MHRSAAGLFSLSAAGIVTFALDESTRPSPLAIPILVGLLFLSALVWWLTRPTKENPGNRQETHGDHSPAVLLQRSPVTINQPSAARQVLEPPLNRALADGLSELESVSRQLTRAAQDGYLETGPSDNHYRPLANRLTDQGWHESRRVVDDAYGACAEFWERLNSHERGWEAGPAEFAGMTIPTIENSDDLPRVLEKVGAAIAELRRLQDQGAAQAP